MAAIVEGRVLLDRGRIEFDLPKIKSLKGILPRPPKPVTIKNMEKAIGIGNAV